MKRFLTICLTCAALSVPMVLTGCGGNDANAPASSETQTNTFSDAQELMEACWKADDSKDKPSIVGGLGEEMKENSPWTVSLNDTEVASMTFVIPVDVLNETENASGMMNAMMANHFTAIALKLKDGADTKKAAKAIADQIQSNQWICGIPEEFKIISKDQYIISCFGLSNVVNPFMDAASKTLGVSAVDYSGPLE